MLLPNQLTTLRIILTPFFAYFYLSPNPLFKKISLVIFLVAALTDWYDGWLARKFNYFTNFGKFMDPLADKILTSTAFFCFVYLGVLEMWMVVLIVIRDLLITILRSVAEYIGENMSTSKAAKWKTAFQMVFLYYLLFIYTFIYDQSIYRNYKLFFDVMSDKIFVHYSMLFITLFTVVTGVHYLFKNRKIILAILPK